MRAVGHKQRDTSSTVGGARGRGAAAQAFPALLGGVLGLVSIGLIFAPAVASSGAEPAFDAPPTAILRYIRSLGSAGAQFGSFVMVLGIMLWLVFAISALCVLRSRDGWSWRLPAAGAAAIVFVAATSTANAAAAAFRADTDAAIARYAFDQGNLSFANGWIALGLFAALTGWESLASRTLPPWLGWWAVIAGVGLVAARAVWTTGFWFVPYALFWLWVAAVSVALLVGALREGRPGRGLRS